MLPARSRSLFSSLAVAGVLLASAPQPATATPGTTIKAVVVKSWSWCTSNSVIWADLSANWSLYGSIPIVIDYSNLDLCASSITVTHDALVASGADVLILCDPAGGVVEYSQSEIDAIQQYVSEGHNIIATFLTFTYTDIDNRGLAPIFGIRKDTTFTFQNVVPTYDLRWPNAALFRNVPDPFQSSGYGQTQLPGDGQWSGEELTFGQLAAKTAGGDAVVVVRAAKTHAAIYVSSMPEYGGGTQDKQFFYNAIIYPRTG